MLLIAMKNKYTKVIQSASSIFLLSCLLLSTGCDKEIVEKQWDAYTPEGIDTTGGNWKAIVVSHDSVSVAAPNAISSSAYMDELQELKTRMTFVTDDQKDAITYWSYGALRWNEIARQLVAKYNLAPEAKSDGTYPFPDATHPSEYPLFPFANPPYASRVYAYLSVAQYDGLVSAWHYKYLYQRLAPHKVDAGLIPLLISYDLPSYPSEDAVIAAASCAVLKGMFPLEVVMLDNKLEEHKNSRMWAGANVQSDITAGDALGKAIAAKVMSRAKTDGFSEAKGTQLIWDSLANVISASGGTPWYSLETPPRPPQLPLFCNVKLWTFDNATKISLRPPPPPAIGSAEFQTAIKKLV